MARHLRRLSIWFLAGVAALALLALLAMAALWWWFDPDDYREQIQARASSMIGRQVHLTGALRWQPGWHISIVSDGGEIANAAGFGSEPMVRWSRIRLGLAARPLFKKRVLIDRIEVHGLQLRLQRNAAGAVNWQLQDNNTGEQSAAQSVTVRIAEVAVHDGSVHYQDAGSSADWRVAALEASAKLPADLRAEDRQFRDVRLEGRVAGGPLAATGVPFAVQTSLLQWSAQRLQVPEFKVRWADARLDGEVAAQLSAPDVTTRFSLEAPSLRALLATVSIAPPPVRDPATLGKLRLSAGLHYAMGTTTFSDLVATLDDTHLQGSIALQKFEPLALRFDLVADRVDLDRYRQPADVKGKALELPLAWLKQLDARGRLSILQARGAGAVAKEVRIDVE